MNNGQKAILPLLGYEKEERIEVNFGNDPKADLMRAGIHPCTIAVVAPHHVIFSLLTNGYRVVEFINRPSARKRGVFICEGAYVTALKEVIVSHPGGLPPSVAYLPKREYIPCPIPGEEQEEGDLAPLKKET
jgi:hypothetical protein